MKPAHSRRYGSMSFNLVKEQRAMPTENGDGEGDEDEEEDEQEPVE
jgi:hypothetical protein